MADKATPIERMFVQVFGRELSAKERKELLTKPKKTRKPKRTGRKHSA
jgi:hypothetical protein